MKILGILLTIGGVLGLVYQGFTYVKPHHVATIGSTDITYHTHQFVWISPAVSIIALVVGLILVLSPRRT